MDPKGNFEECLPIFNALGVPSGKRYSSS